YSHCWRDGRTARMSVPLSPFSTCTRTGFSRLMSRMSTGTASFRPWFCTQTFGGVICPGYAVWSAPIATVARRIMPSAYAPIVAGFVIGHLHGGHYGLLYFVSMRIIFAVLTIGAVATIAAAQARSKPAPPAARPAAKPAGTLAQVMRGVYFPNANLIFDVQQHDPAAPKAKGDAGR